MLGFSPIASEPIASAQTAQASGTISGAIAWLEASDSIAMSGTSLAAGSAALAWTEVADVIAIAGNVASVPVVGTIAWTEEADVSAVPSFPQAYVFTMMRDAPIYVAAAIRNAPINLMAELI